MNRILAHASDPFVRRRLVKRFIPAALIALFLLAALACGTGPAPSNQVSNSAQVRIVQGASDTGSVDVFVNGAKQPTPPMAPMTTPPYFKTNAGSMHFEMVSAGNSGPILIDTLFPIAANTFATVATVGRLSNQSLTTILLVDDHSAPPAGKLKLRLLHGASTMGAVDVYITRVGEAPASPAAFENLTFDSATSYLSLPRENFETCVMRPVRSLVRSVRLEAVSASWTSSFRYRPVVRI
jgi:hypothetical protein